MATNTKHSAPGQYLGFALQPVRLCFHLLSCGPGVRVSLEYLDDVALHYPDGRVCLEQTKSALSHNPLSDWAEDLWKTLANWVQALAGSQVPQGQSSFRLYVTPPRTGTLAQALSDATTVAEVATLLGTVAKKRAALARAPACSAHLDTVLAASPELQAAVVQNMVVESAHDDPVDALRAILAPTVAAELIDTLAMSAIGMAKQQADRLIAIGHPALLAGDSFKREFQAFVRKNLMTNLLPSLEPPPEPVEVANWLTGRPTFVRQLELIGASQEQRIRAVSDYLRTSADKADWAERGLVLGDSLREYDEDLVRRHGLIASGVAARFAGHPAEQRGCIIYADCALQQVPLEGRVVPGHFLHGSYHALADVPQIGWHPDFAALLGALAP